MTIFRIAIAGCGPAGLAAALLLDRAGHDITLYERFETPRPIGSGLMIQPTGLAVLERLGLGAAARRAGSRIDRLFGQTGASGRTVLDVHYSALGADSAHGIGIHRGTLFRLLHDAVLARSIPIKTGHTISGSTVEGQGRRLHFQNGEATGPFDLIVDALGSRTPLAPPCGRTLAYGALWASLDWPDGDGGGFDHAALEQRYRAASVMAGVLPIGRLPGSDRLKTAFFWSLRGDRRQAWLDDGLDRWKHDVMALWPETEPFLDQIVRPQDLTFAAYRHRSLPRPAQQRLIHIGDAWHSASPQLGQGANMALLDAWALALALALDQTGAVDPALRLAVRLRRRHVLTYQLLSALFTPVYQSDSRVLPFVRDRLVGPLSKLWPATWIQAAMVSGLIGNPLAPLGLSPADRPR